VTRIRPVYVALAGLIVLLLSIALATVGTRSGPPTCPEGGIIRKHDPRHCLVPTDQPDAASSIATVAPTRDFHTGRRLLIIAVGVVIGVGLAAASVRLASRQARGPGPP
jgi:hypothetical protein